MNMASNCDVTNSAHQIQMTTTCHWMNPPMKNFCLRHCAALSVDFSKALLMILDAVGVFLMRFAIRIWKRHHRCVAAIASSTRTLLQMLASHQSSFQENWRRRDSISTTEEIYRVPSVCAKRWCPPRWVYHKAIFEFIWLTLNFQSVVFLLVSGFRAEKSFALCCVITCRAWKVATPTLRLACFCFPGCVVRLFAVTDALLLCVGTMRWKWAVGQPSG